MKLRHRVLAAVALAGLAFAVAGCSPSGGCNTQYTAESVTITAIDPAPSGNSCTNDPVRVQLSAGSSSGYNLHVSSGESVPRACLSAMGLTVGSTITGGRTWTSTGSCSPRGYDPPTALSDLCLSLCFADASTPADAATDAAGDVGGP